MCPLLLFVGLNENPALVTTRYLDARFYLGYFNQDHPVTVCDHLGSDSYVEANRKDTQEG